MGSHSIASLDFNDLFLDPKVEFSKRRAVPFDPDPKNWNLERTSKKRGRMWRIRRLLP